MGEKASRADDAAKGGRRLLSPLAHKIKGFCHCALPDGRLASGFWDEIPSHFGNQVLIWKAGVETTIKPLLTLVGLEGCVQAICPLPEGRLAAGGDDGIVLVWDVPRVAAGTETGAGKTIEPLLMLTGHKGEVYYVFTLSRHKGEIFELCALLRGWLAAGCQDGVVLVWDVLGAAFDTKAGAGKNIKPLLTLGGQGGIIRALCTLPKDLLASGGDDGIVRIWNYRYCAAGAKAIQPVQMLNHAGCIRALCSLDEGRLASGGDDGIVLIWNVLDVAKATQPLLRLRGHVGCICALCPFSDGRLASGGNDGIVRIWDVPGAVEVTNSGDETMIKPLLMLRGHNRVILDVSPLDNGRFASGSIDGVVLIWDLEFMLDVVPGLVRATSSSSAYSEVEEAIKKHSLGGRLDSVVGVVFGALQSYTSYPVMEKRGNFLELVMHVSEVITSIILEEKDEATRERLVEEVVSGLWPLVEDVKFASLLSAVIFKFDVPDEIRQKVLASPLVWTIVLAQYQSGPWLAFWVDFFAFCVLAGCYSRLAYLQLVAEEARIGEQYLCAAVVFFILLYFSLCELLQMSYLRAQEYKNAQDRDFESRVHTRRSTKLGLFSVLFFHLLVFLIFIPSLPLLVPLLWARPGLRTLFEKQRQLAFKRLLWDPLLFVGFSRNYRESIWNLVDNLAYWGLWAVLVSTVFFRRGRGDGDARHRDLVVLTTMLLWIKLLGFVKRVSLEFASFVSTLLQIFWDVHKFMVVFLILLMLFSHALFLRLGAHESSQYGFHDDGKPSTFGTFGKTLQAMTLLGVTGDFDSDSYPETFDVVIFDLAAFMIIVVMLPNSGAFDKREAVLLKVPQWWGNMQGGMWSSTGSCA